MIVFVSNFLNHHQFPICDALIKLTGGDFVFIATEPIHAERLNMGYADMNHKYDFVLCSYDSDENRQKALKLCFDCDVLIHGSAPDEYFKARVKAKRITFKYGERFFKTPFVMKNILPRTLSMLKHVIPYQNKNYYLLCASAYMSKDSAIYGCFRERCFKWGYFPAVKKYDNIDELIGSKHPASILWVARLIEFKHPEMPIAVAKRLKADGYDFKINMIGNGELEAATRELIEREGVADCVEMLGAMKPHEVREHMEKSEIFLFTSDRNEGWGAVMNESMNSACAVVANSAIGSVPFLISDGENGYMYKDGDVDDLYNKVKKLLDNADERKQIGKNAYKTMIEEWNAENAAEKFIALCEKMLSGEYKPFPYDSGVCSKAKILKDNWYK